MKKKRKQTFTFPQHSDCAVKAEAPQATDEEAAKKLWDMSADMAKLNLKS